LRGLLHKDINNPIANFTNYAKLETSKNRFIFKYEKGQVISLVRVRTINKDKQSVLSKELGLD